MPSPASVNLVERTAPVKDSSSLYPLRNFSPSALKERVFQNSSGRVPDDARTEGVAFQHQPVVHAVLEIAVLDGRLGGIFAELGGADLGKLVVALFLRRLDFRFRLIHLKVVQVDVGIFFRVPPCRCQ